LNRPSAALLILFGFLVTTALEADPDFPVTLTDASGYRLTLAAKPKAIVSLTLATDEMLVELVDPGRLKAIDQFAADPGISNVAEFARNFPTKIAAEKERILALQPDLVFLADWKEKEFAQALREAGVPVFVFKAADNLDELRDSVDHVAALVGEPARGKALNASIDGRLRSLTSRVSRVPANRRLSILSYSFFGTTYAEGTSFDALVEQAGLVNAATRAGMKGWPQLSKEQVLALDPDIIALPSWSYGGKTDPEKFLASFLADPVFASLKAVKTKRVLLFQDRHLMSNSQYMVDGVEDLARAAYPELFR